MGEARETLEGRCVCVHVCVCACVCVYIYIYKIMTDFQCCMVETNIKL